MILTCPTCSTRYLLDPARLGGDGRLVRCGKCSHTWHQAPPPDMPKAVDPLPFVTEEIRPIPPGSNLPAFPPVRRQRSNAAGWVALLVVVIAILAAGLVAREQIVQAWPPAAKLYSAVGLGAALPVAPGDGLEVRHVTSKRVMEDGAQVLVIEGEVANVSQGVREVPPLRGTLRDAQEHDLQQWTFGASASKLQPGETASFSTKLKNPAAAATGISITFAPSDKG